MVSGLLRTFGDPLFNRRLHRHDDLGKNLFDLVEIVKLRNEALDFLTHELVPGIRGTGRFPAEDLAQLANHRRVALEVIKALKLSFQLSPKRGDILFDFFNVYNLRFRRLSL